MSLASKIDYPEDQVFALLVDPNNWKWIRDYRVSWVAGTKPRTKSASALVVAESRNRYEKLFM